MDTWYCKGRGGITEVMCKMKVNKGLVSCRDGAPRSRGVCDCVKGTKDGGGVLSDALNMVGSCGK